MKGNTLIFLITLSLSAVQSLPRSQITIDQGILEGTTLSTNSGYLYDVYYTIPFAVPPIGNMRFKDPEPAQGWEGIRDATSPGPECFQILNISTVEFIGDEDCLYLNVYTPSYVDGDSNLTVMVWIHGGGLSEGSANEYDGKFLVEKDVVVVTTNYRLGFTGFLALNNADVPGNAGAKDLVMALEWVIDNIQQFGGDPNKVTIFGESAGGALSHFLTMSPVATGLFGKAIIQSGASISEWPIQEDTESIISLLFQVVGVYTENTYDLLNILWNVPIELAALIACQIPLTDGRITPFRPIIEGDYSTNAFIKEHPRHLMETGEFNHIPTMSGFTSQEGVFFLHLIDIYNANTVEDIIADFSFYLPGAIRNSLTSEEKEVVMNKIRDFYFPDNQNLIYGFIDLNSDHQFIKDMDNTARIFSKYDPNTYYYQFLYHGELNYFKYLVDYNYTGAAHADELGYVVFDMFSTIHNATEQDLLTLRRLTEMWSNFAKYGNPTPEVSEDVDVIWKPVTEDEVNCLFIDSDLSVEINPLQERLQFWRDLESQYGKK